MSRVIGSASSQEIKPWRMPELDDAGGDVTSRKSALEAKPEARMHFDPAQTQRQEKERLNLLTAEKIAEIQAQAYREGFEQGRDEGRKAGLGDLQSKAKRFEMLMARLARPFEQLDAQVEQELLALVGTLTRLLVRREIASDISLILEIVQEALQALPMTAREVRLSLHPDDAALVREWLSESEEERSWRIVDDQRLGRGDCRVISDTSQIDASLETRLKMLIATILDGEAAQETAS